MREKANSGQLGDAVERAGLDSPARRDPPLADDLPPYGAQHCQDALWKGGNEALPPRWWQFKVGDGPTEYQDDNLAMSSWNRPLPGVRLDEPGQLIVGCEWHISPLGRSYFVNHNTGTTSWTKPTPERPAGSLTPECVIEGHTECIWSLACVGSCNVMSASDDGSICQWKRDGEPVGAPWRCGGGGVGSMAVSPDETMVASGSVDGRIRLWNVQDGKMIGKPWNGHGAPVRCLDWSPNSREIASGSQDGTIRRWNPDAGHRIGPTLGTGHGWVYTVKYSPQGDKFVSGGADRMVRVWSTDGKVLVQITGHTNMVRALCWSKDGMHIFSGSADHTIRKWQSTDGKELVVLRGHTNTIRSLRISHDERHLISASEDCSVRIWNLKGNRQVGNPLLHDDEILALAITSDGQYIASAGLDRKIYLWSVAAALEQDGDGVHPHESAQPKGLAALLRHIFDISPISTLRACNTSSAICGDSHGVDNSDGAPRCSAQMTIPSPPRRRGLFSFLRFITQPEDASQSVPLQSRGWNFSSFTGRTAPHAPVRDEDTYGSDSPTGEEVTALMYNVNGNAVHGSTSTSQSQDIRMSQDDIQAMTGCCGFVVRPVRPRPILH